MSLAKLAAFLGLAGPLAAQTVIDFDNALGQAPTFSQGQPVRPFAMIDRQYLPLGVLFDSQGGGLFRAAPSNPVSAPNAVGATEPGPVVSYVVPAVASFWLGDVPAAVDYVQLALTSSTSAATLEAYDFEGNLLGISIGGASAVLRVDAPGEIHFAVVHQGPMALDDFTFDGLQPIAALSVAPPSPGHAGASNTLVVTGAVPFEPLLLWIDLGEGTSPAIVSLLADAGGRAEHALAVPAALAGVPLRARVAASAGTSPWVSDVLAPAELSSQSLPSLEPKSPKSSGAKTALIPPQ